MKPPYTTDFKEFVKYLFKWMQDSTNAREMIFDVADGKLAFKWFLDAHNPEDWDGKNLEEKYSTLKYFKATETKRACKLAALNYALKFF